MRHTISTRATTRSLQERPPARPGLLQIYLGPMRLFTSVVLWSSGLPVERKKSPVYLWQLGNHAFVHSIPVTILNTSRVLPVGKLLAMVTNS